MKTITQSINFDCPAHSFYDAFTSQSQHERFTQSDAHIEAWVGGTYTADGEGWVGEFVKLAPDELIGLSWRCIMEGWPEDHYSTITMHLHQSSDGVEVEFIQTGVPDKCYESIADGWYEFFWEPLRELLEAEI